MSVGQVKLQNLKVQSHGYSLEGRYSRLGFQTSYTAPSYGVISHGALSRSIWVHANHTCADQMQTKCPHYFCAHMCLQVLLSMQHLFTLRLQ